MFAWLSPDLDEIFLLVLLIHFVQTRNLHQSINSIELQGERRFFVSLKVISYSPKIEPMFVQQITINQFLNPKSHQKGMPLSIHVKSLEDSINVSLWFPMFLKTKV